MEMKEVSIIIVAGGKGLRMGGDQPKQYMELMGIPILVHTLINLQRSAPRAEYILVVPKNDHAMIRKMLQNHGIEGISITSGGGTRAESVANGLSMATRSFVAVHDSVRPFVSTDLLIRLFDTLNGHDAVAPAVAPVDSTRLLSDDGQIRTVSRDRLFLMQTPQCFRRELLETAYKNYFSSPCTELTDDVSIVEYYCGYPPKIIPGEDTNIKITTPKDLAIARYILEKK